jgi:GH15 family glucan-1,4-alpha-glucosidase
MLCDWATGAVIAAPEFDPGYEMCGGYGYCWPRDAADAVLALDEAGYPEFLAAAAAWMVGAQLPGGVWGQRYWCDGQVASSWALRDDFLQLDETSSALLLLCRAGAAGDGQPDARLVEAIRAGAAALLARLSPEGYHASACDLWETYAGTFAYTQASVAAALRESAALLERLGDPQAAAIRAAADMARKAALSFYRGGYFLRGRMDGRLDTTADSSTLGLVEPFGVLDLRNPAHWEMARSNLLVIERRLGFDYPDGRGIRRYEGDPYLGGAVGAVNTLWAALVCYRLAETAADTAERKTLTGRAELYLRTVLARTTPAGLLPELLPNLPGVPYWAAPHAWASGLVVKCALAASRLGAEADSRGS